MVKTIRISSFLLSATLIGGLTVAVPTNVGAQELRPGFSALVPVGPFRFNFDENGHGTIQVGAAGAITTLNGTLALDPAGPIGGSQLVLTYMLPEPVIAGDVQFLEIAGAQVTSDWLRFTDASGILRGATGAGSRMIFYSELEANETAGGPGVDLADRIFPTNLGSGNVLLGQLEIGTEGNNGFNYLPGGAFPNNNQYIGISDIPEPETYALMLAGLGLLGFVARRRTQKAA